MEREEDKLNTSNNRSYGANLNYISSHSLSLTMKLIARDMQRMRGMSICFVSWRLEDIAEKKNVITGQFSVS